MHNFSGYDSHLILPFLTKSYLPEIKNVTVIPRSGEIFLSITINKKVTFLDSKFFLSGSLDSLFEAVKSTCSFTFIKQSSLISDINESGKKSLKSNYEERMLCLTGKGCFPYEWAKSVEDYSLPYLTPKSAFYNSITRSDICEDEYNKAKQTWNVFQMKTMRDYMETYCMCDTLLLAEVFEKFRTESMDNFEIEPCHFISLPGFAFQAFLKTTQVELEYITDANLFDMLSSNLRGGHSFSSQRYEESSAFKDMLSNGFSASEDLQQHILYIDANNL